jgi:hypothetical protein
MILIAITIKDKEEGKYMVACDLLKREDANDKEWKMAKLLEAASLKILETIAEEMVSSEYIGDPKEDPRSNP